MSFDKSRLMAQRFHALIPGGAHTYAKGDDQYPGSCRLYIDRGLGCHVWDVDGNEFIEYGMGLKAVTLGHAYAPVGDFRRASDAAPMPEELARGLDPAGPTQDELAVFNPRAQDRQTASHAAFVANRRTESSQPKLCPLGASQYPYATK